MSLNDFRDFDPERAELGRLLFYDPILSGNRNISCGTCHHHDLASTDGLSLGIGQGGSGIGLSRIVPIGSDLVQRRVKRNSPALFNVGAREFKTIFHDGRVSTDDYFGNGFNSPAEEFLPAGLEHVLAVQSIFPLVSETEMLGRPEDNRVAAAVNERVDYGWPLIVERVRGIDAYAPFFLKAFEDLDSFQELSISHIGNALGDFVASEWRSFDSRFDRFVEGDSTALDANELQGMRLFFGEGNCASCHSGKFFTDQGFHALGIPPFGPGRARAFDLHVRDVGRMAESDRLEDAYRFRTPSLRNVELTAPYGHNGAYANLEGVVRHHLEPEKSLVNWDRGQVVLTEVLKFRRSDFIIYEDKLEMARFRQFLDIEPVELSQQQIDYIILFLKSLTGAESVKGRMGRPEAVPSGLKVD